MGQKYFLPTGVFFVATLLISNTVASKLVQFGPFTFTGAILIFPLSYIFGDILTEVYGYRASRQIIWLGFASLLLMSVFYTLTLFLPAAPFWPHQEAFRTILGVVPRITIASIIGYFCGEFANSYVLSKLKVKMQGRKLWVRTIGSTVVGEGVDTVIFVLVGFVGIIPTAQLVTVMVSGYLFKVLYEVIATPATYAIVKKLKQAEHADVYDTDVNYSPFILTEK